MRNFHVEGRYFEDTLTAFTFAGIQADRMSRPVEVHKAYAELGGLPAGPAKTTWHATAQPSNYVRSHLVTQL